jgi:heat-inducible transcriptional repressor
MTLSERRRRLLQHIVEEHVQTTQPVGSNALVEKYSLGVSSATIRNEMAALEDEGYIAQPHTSAGRVPTDAGYRYYVQSLMREEAPTEDVQQTIRHQFHQAARELDQWARLSAAILASRLKNAAVVTAPHSDEPRIKLLELVSVHDYVVLLVVVLQEARVLQQTISLEEPHTQDDLTKVARKLNEALAGKTASEIRALTGETTPIESVVTQAAVSLLDAAENLTLEQSFLDGMRDLLRQPEFNEGDRLLRLLEVLEERNLPRAIPVPAAEGDVNVVIGTEHPVDEMRVCSVVTTRYTGPSGLRGTLSVVGPTRLHYPRTVAMVRHMGTLMEELLGVYFT